MGNKFIHDKNLKKVKVRTKIKVKLKSN
jgi:hypothetical protein